MQNNEIGQYYCSYKNEWKMFVSYFPFCYNLRYKKLTPQENNSTQHNKVESHHEMKVLY